MKKFTKNVIETFYSKSFYANLILRGKGIGGAYILLKAFLAMCVPVFLILFSSGWRQTVESVVAQFPEVRIEASKLSIDRPSPYVIDLPIDKKEAPKIVFDTGYQEADAGKVDIEMATKKILVLVTSNYVAFKKKNQVDFYYFNNYDELKGRSYFIDQDRWMAFHHTVLRYGVPLVVVAIVLVSFGSEFVGTAIFSMLALLFSAFFSIKLDFSTAMRLAAASAIPGVFIEMAFGAFKAHPFLGFFFLLHALFIIYGMVSAQKEADSGECAA
ncbi:MAG: DUF1189 family protein [Alphaproteobacteria bacterium]|nr:DUF1189 family protein [Alphaproteobacteria bacterium]